jgi:magnesium transporter
MVKAKYNKFDFLSASGVDEMLENTLEVEYGINSLDVEDIFSDTQLSKIEIRSSYVYVALQFPEFDKSYQKFFVKDLHCFVSRSWVIVIDKQGYKHFQQFVNFQDQLLEDEHETTSFVFFAELLEFCTTKTYKVLPKFRQEINQIESDLFEFTNDIDVLKDILIMKKNLVNFESVVGPIKDVIVELEYKAKRLLEQDEVDKFDNSLDIIKKIINNLQNFKEQMNLLSETNESMIGRSTNNQVRALTAVSLIGLVPTFWVGFFGMNVHFGFVENSFVPLIVVIGLITVSCSVLYWFFKKKGYV